MSSQEAKKKGYSEYWDVRAKILEALSQGNEAALKEIAVLYPKIFMNVANQARNSNLKARKGLPQ